MAGNSIPQGNTRVCISSRVKHDNTELSLCLLNPSNQITFGVGLAKFNLHPYLGGAFLHFCLNISERRFPIDFGLALPQQVQVRTVQKENLHPLERLSSRFGFVELIS